MPLPIPQTKADVLAQIKKETGLTVLDGQRNTFTSPHYANTTITIDTSLSTVWFNITMLGGKGKGSAEIMGFGLEKVGFEFSYTEKDGIKLKRQQKITPPERLLGNIRHMMTPKRGPRSAPQRKP